MPIAIGSTRHAPQHRVLPNEALALTTSSRNSNDNGCNYNSGSNDINDSENDSDENAFVIVDSSDDIAQPTTPANKTNKKRPSGAADHGNARGIVIDAVSKYDRDRAIAETIERVASAATSDVESDGEDSDNDDGNNTGDRRRIDGNGVSISCGGRSNKSASDSGVSQKSQRSTISSNHGVRSAEHKSKGDSSTPISRTVSAKSQPASLSACAGGKFVFIFFLYLILFFFLFF